MITPTELQKKMGHLGILGRLDSFYIWCVTYEGEIISVLLKDIVHNEYHKRYSVMVSPMFTESLSYDNFFWNREGARLSICSGSRK